MGAAPWATLPTSGTNGLGFGQSHLVLPDGTTDYSVTVSDGCSDPAIGTLTVTVLPEIQLSFQDGPTVCYGDTTWALVVPNPPGNYSYTWQTNPPFSGQQFFGLSRTYTVEVVDLERGCKTEGDVTLPGYDPIAANFSVSPQGECVTIVEPYVEILDFSNGGISGSWNFDDGTIIPYQEGANIGHSYSDTGTFVITLQIQNEGGCTSTFSATACVEAITTLFVPNALTPNDDGRNDYFQLTGTGVADLTWQIFDRWGTMVFEGVQPG